jgi:hypothetical protein
MGFRNFGRPFAGGAFGGFWHGVGKTPSCVNMYEARGQLLLINQ